MTYLNSAMLWGLLALAIPVAIHFWYQKKGKTLDWAAFQWLADETTLTHRGIRLDEIPLLLLRCLLLIIFILVLAKPVMNFLNPKTAKQRVHLVEPNNFVVNNFRFELEKAFKNGEKIYWISKEQTALKDLENVPEFKKTEQYLQRSVTRLGNSEKQLNLYITNSKKWSDLPKVIVPESFKLFSIPDSSEVSGIPYLDLGEGKRLFVEKKRNGTGSFRVAETDDSSARFADEPAHTGTIKVLIAYKIQAEQQAISAALSALTDVYSIPFAIDVKKKKDEKYDWIFTDKNVSNVLPKTLYFVSDHDLHANDNLIQIPDSLKMQSSELVRDGRLPEWIGEVLIDHYQLDGKNTEMSQRQLAAIFEKAAPGFLESTDKIYSWLTLCFLVLLALERWISLKKTSVQAYA